MCYNPDSKYLLKKHLSTLADVGHACAKGRLKVLFCLVDPTLRKYYNLQSVV
jgi:hypothetical protein